MVFSKFLAQQIKTVGLIHLYFAVPNADNVSLCHEIS